jgi:hypothetical protein
MHKKRRSYRGERSEGRRDRKKEVKTQAQTVLTLGLDQITKFINRLDGPLGESTYSGLTQSVFLLDRVKSSSCDCPAKINVDVDSNASCFTCFSSGSSSPEVAEFCPTLRLVYLLLRPKPPLAHYPEFIVCLATTLFKK